MPRDGSGIYTTPAGTTAVPDTTIESTKYNNNVADVAADLNAPRPIIAGGTGANNAVDAANNLGVVTGKGAQTFTEAEKAVARNNIAAAPLDALAYNGMQVNGSMDVSQELGFANSRTTSGYVCDGWTQFINGTMVVASQVNGAAVFAFSNFLNVSVTTAQTTIGASNYMFVMNVIEGYRTARLGWGTASAQPVTIGFWTAHARPGTYSVSIRNGAANRSYCTTYTQNVANAAEYKTVTIPGDVTGTWEKTNGTGFYVAFAMAYGSGGITPTNNAWVTGSFTAAIGQINGVAATSDVFRLTGVVVLPGTQAPTAAQSPLIMRPYDQELVTCQRYFRHSYPAGVAIGAASQNATAIQDRRYLTSNDGYPTVSPVYFDPIMRASPTITLYSPNSGNAGRISCVGPSSSDITANPVNVTEKSFTAQGDGATVVNAGANSFYLHYKADARL